jgi:hypothetical protein
MIARHMARPKDKWDLLHNSHLGGCCYAGQGHRPSFRACCGVLGIRDAFCGVEIRSGTHQAFRVWLVDEGGVAPKLLPLWVGGWVVS